MAILLKELILQREEEMMNAGFLYSKTRNVKKYWNEFSNYCNNLKVYIFEEKYVNEFLKEFSSNPLNEKKVHTAKNAINILVDFNSLFSLKPKIDNDNIDESFRNELNMYLDYSKNVRNNSIKTILEKEKETIKFIKFLKTNKIGSFQNINNKIILLFINTYNDKIKSSRITMCWNLRGLLKYLYDENIVNQNYLYLIPVIKREKSQKIPTVFEKEDVINILNQLKEDRVYTLAGKRNYAIILIAAKTGLRMIDIKNLKWENIDWKNNCFSIIQEKTKKELTIPFTQDIGEAIIEYIKSERPFKINNEQDVIFIRHRYPYIKLSKNFYMYDVIQRAAQRGSIDLSKYNKKGIHTFRFTLATEMLNNEIPINIIASTLGHCNIKTANNYLKVDINHLKECFCEVEYDV